MVTNGAFQGDREGRPYHIATNPLLEVKNLNVDYLAASGTVHAVTDVSFSLRRYHAPPAPTRHDYERRNPLLSTRKGRYIAISGHHQ